MTEQPDQGHYLAHSKIQPPLAGVMDIASLASRPRVRLLDGGFVSEFAEHVRASAARWVWVEGFSGAGKSMLAHRLAYRLGWRCVELDGLVRDDPLPSNAYADFIDASKLAAQLGTLELRTRVVVDGVCLRDVLARVNDTEPGLIVYVARVSRATSGSLRWHDGLDIESPSNELPWLTLATIGYHERCEPYKDAATILLRIEN